MELAKILVVADSQLVQRGYELILRRRKSSGELQILRAYNGREALKRLHEHPDCDLILFDVNLPGRSDLELVERFKSGTAFLRTPVVVISTEAGEGDVVRGLEACADAYLVKPFCVEELHRLVERLTLARAGSAGSAKGGSRCRG